MAAATARQHCTGGAREESRDPVPRVKRSQLHWRRRLPTGRRLGPRRSAGLDRALVRKRRAQSQRRRRSMVRGSPTAEEVQQEKLKAVKEVPSIRGKMPGQRTMPPPSAYISSDSDN
ncbi:hypothetical protein NDU88_006107 [Pleurodeles waltl]|uniref:Uncharacterized protein n=1 Tax=Pleurodeles waltl TaxID=8319 RepID=A0AAV7TDH2_PLEWA|nr:hypothetical protein NDU88_006107 [Pleurodeles waltl]